MTSVRLQRVIPAKPAQVYRAWLDPDLLARWMIPGEPAGVRAEVDERAGGHYRIFHPGGGGFDAVLLELDEDRRLVFRWGFAGPDRREGPVFDSELTVTFEDAGDGGTLLTLVHDKLDAFRAAMPEAADGVEYGWTVALDNLTGVRL
jgi:uncharacterized protein YndB with AHSA1/START domain